MTEWTVSRSAATRSLFLPLTCRAAGEDRPLMAAFICGGQNNHASSCYEAMALCQARQSYPGSGTGQSPSVSQYISNCGCDLHHKSWGQTIPNLWWPIFNINPPKSQKILLNLRPNKYFRALTSFRSATTGKTHDSLRRLSQRSVYHRFHSCRGAKIITIFRLPSRGN